MPCSHRQLMLLSVNEPTHLPDTRRMSLHARPSSSEACDRLEQTRCKGSMPSEDEGMNVFSKAKILSPLPELKRRSQHVEQCSQPTTELRLCCHTFLPSVSTVPATSPATSTSDPSAALSMCTVLLHYDSTCQYLGELDWPHCALGDCNQTGISFQAWPSVTGKLDCSLRTSTGLTELLATFTSTCA